MKNIDALSEFGNAIFSEDRKYRYILTRSFPNRVRPPVVFIMLNPSTADEHVGDPTIRRCIRYAWDWQYGGLVVLNLFALRATDPRELYKAEDPIGPDNDFAIEQVMGDPFRRTSTPVVICAWGNHGNFQSRGKNVQNLLQTHCGVIPKVLRLTAASQPAHPLYLPSDLKPIAW